MLNFQRLCKNSRTPTICLHTQQPQIPPAGLWASSTVIDGRDEVNLFDLCED